MCKAMEIKLLYLMLALTLNHNFTEGSRIQSAKEVAT